MATQTSSTGRESDKFMLRLPDGMRAKLKASAEAAGRTMNAELIARLEKSFEDNDAPLLARAIARLEMSLAGEEALHQMTALQLANLGKWVVKVLEGEGVGDENERAKLLDSAKSFAANMNDVFRGAEEKLQRFKVTTRGLPAPSQDALAIRDVVGRSHNSTGGAIEQLEGQEPAKRRAVRKRVIK